MFTELSFFFFLIESLIFLKVVSKKKPQNQKNPPIGMTFKKNPRVWRTICNTTTILHIYGA